MLFESFLHSEHTNLKKICFRPGLNYSAYPPLTVHGRASSLTQPMLFRGALYSGFLIATHRQKNRVQCLNALHDCFKLNFINV
jgi:hypothetical protein